MVRRIANVIKASGCSVPEWMLELKPAKKKQRSRTIERAPISAAPEAVAGYASMRAARHKQKKRKTSKQISPE